MLNAAENNKVIKSLNKAAIHHLARGVNDLGVIGVAAGVAGAVATGSAFGVIAIEAVTAGVVGVGGAIGGVVALSAAVAGVGSALTRAATVIADTTKECSHDISESLAQKFNSVGAVLALAIPLTIAGGAGYTVHNITQEKTRPQTTQSTNYGLTKTIPAVGFHFI